MQEKLTFARKCSYGLMALALVAAARFGLGPAVIAGLFAHMLLSQADGAMRGAGLSPRAARWAAAGFFLVIGVLLAMIFTSFLRIGVSRFPQLLERVLPRLDGVASHFGVELPFDTGGEVREAGLEWIRTHVQSITSTSGLLTRGFFQVATAVFIALLRYMTDAPSKPEKESLDTEVIHECRRRAALFSASFDRVMSAQILIAAINAAAAAAFLFIFHFPFRTILTLTTFVCGLLPIVGNVVSNGLIVAAALTRSEQLALWSLVFLIVVHKASYLLNSRIVGARISTSTWAILLALLAGEAVLGVPGVILAPTLLYYVREELRALPAR
jgi:predicted PurR-regulated permease PerM